MNVDPHIIYALLTARGNNTLKDKNILPVKGLPTIAYPAMAAKKSKLISDYYISSDCHKILAVGREYGFKEIIRPGELALPNALHYDVIAHFLQYLKEQIIIPDIIVVLLGNSVTIKSTWIDICLSMILEDKSISAVVPAILNNDHHPYRCKRLSSLGYLEEFVPLPALTSSNRQDLPPAYFLAHNFWVLRTNIILNKDNHGSPPWPFMGKNVKPFLVEEAFDIHTEQDLVKSSMWLDSNWP